MGNTKQARSTDSPACIAEATENTNPARLSIKPVRWFDSTAQRDQALISVLPTAFHAYLPVWIAMHEDLRSTRRMRLIFDALVSGMTAYIRRGSKRH